MLTVKLKKDFYNKRQIEFSFEIEFSVSSGFTVLTGASGAGKTTTLRMIAGIVKPDSGFIKLDSQTFFDSSQNLDLPIQKREVGFVFQDYALFPHLTAKQNIAYGVKIENKNDKAEEMLALFHSEHLINRIPREMSGGEQQRVALARALASEPKIVLLDEPLSAVDVETRIKLLDEIENAQRQTQIPFIYVTHNETEAERFGAQRIRLEKGRIFQ